MSTVAADLEVLPQTTTQPRLVVVLHDSPTVASMLPDAPAAAAAEDLAEAAARVGAVLRPAFHFPRGSFAHALAPPHLPSLAGAPESLTDLSVFYRVDGQPARLERLAEELLRDARIAGAYVEPGTALPQFNAMLPSPQAPPSSTPDFTARQTYRDAAPDGIDVTHAWGHPGGRGANARIIDIEIGWNLAHETLAGRNAALYGGAPRDGSRDGRNHGTAVVGITSAAGAGFGVTGICPDAEFATFSNYGGYSPAEAIQIAADMLDPGDILILEMHRPGPRHGFTARGDQRGYIAVEWWPLDFAAVRYAVSRGILVLSAAGNGAEDLDHARYDGRPAGFPPTWSNPFRRGGSDSGSIIVGAGAPPPGTHGRSHGPARSRLDFSNYGSLVDAQGWGREVTTCGYGDLQGGHDENLWYTDEFSGTSSATPIVAGALACVQGIRKANAKSPLTPAQARALLRNPATGSPQQDGPIVGGVVRFPRTERIGGLPDLSKLIPAALALP